MQQWEYVEITRVFDKEAGFYFWEDDPDGDDQRTPKERLNDLGQEGWELATAYTGDIDNQTVYILKRLISE